MSEVSQLEEAEKQRPCWLRLRDSKANTANPYLSAICKLGWDRCDRRAAHSGWSGTASTLPLPRHRLESQICHMHSHVRCYWLTGAYLDVGNLLRQTQALWAERGVVGPVARGVVVAPVEHDQLQGEGGSGDGVEFGDGMRGRVGPVPDAARAKARTWRRGGERMEGNEQAGAGPACLPAPPPPHAGCAHRADGVLRDLEVVRAFVHLEPSSLQEAGRKGCDSDLLATQALGAPCLPLPPAIQDRLKLFTGMQHRCCEGKCNVR